jgi:uncharacterized membrane protein YphA (DoxX/SURF4 family)
MGAGKTMAKRSRKGSLRRHGVAMPALAALALLLLLPGAARAHEKWFVDESQYPLRWELLFSFPTLVALLAAAAALGALILLKRIVRDPLFPNPVWLRAINPSVHAVLGIQTAISLVYMTVQGWLLAPELDFPDGPLGFILGVLQLLVSFTFVTGWFTRGGGALLIGLVLMAFLLNRPSLAAEQLLFAGIGLFFLIEGRALFRPTTEAARRLASRLMRYESYALPAARILTGASILWLAFSEKLLNPDLALAFLNEYPSFNFMQWAGFNWFSNELFIYAAAAVEATVGVLLISGVLPRVVILFMWLPFNVAIPLLPPQELLGHLPILAVMYAVFLGKDRLPAPAGEPIARTETSPIPART